MKGRIFKEAVVTYQEGINQGFFSGDTEEIYEKPYLLTYLWS
jgi:hypothetical protein